MQAYSYSPLAKDTIRLLGLHDSTSPTFSGTLKTVALSDARVLLPQLYMGHAERGRRDTRLVTINCRTDISIFTMSTTPFSFPALTAGPPSRRNWYQELLDHPDCHGAKQVSEAYESHRSTYLAKNLKAFTGEQNPVTPDQALISHLQRLANSQNPGDPSTEDMKKLDVNCLGISARPPLSIITKIQAIQAQISNFVGPDFYAMPAAHLHIAMVELAHRHTITYLRSIASSVGSARLQNMLDLVATLPVSSSSPLRLVRPRLSVDPMGVALTFVPDPVQEYTYHHLRADMHALALESGESFDMCYTAASAHVTLGRFVGASFFESRASRLAFGELVGDINEALDTADGGEKWVLGEDLGLELQAGYLKFGVERECADMLGRSLST